MATPALTPDLAPLPPSPPPFEEEEGEEGEEEEEEEEEEQGEGDGEFVEEEVVQRRSSIEKTPIAPEDVPLPPPAFELLPDEIIQQILQLTDPNSFASLVLLNSKWRAVSQQAHLYAHQLSLCPSYFASHKTPINDTKAERLPELRRLFAQEVKRNLFEAYLRPNKTVIQLVSNSISSSSCPGGEGMQFNPSPRGHHLLAYNSSRIYVLDMRGPEIDVKRELKILRRPAATCIKDDGSLLAVLLTEMQVDLYDLTEYPPKRTQSIILDHSPRAIAISPCGGVLAAAYEGGIEVSSLNPGALATDRRAVKCDGVDALAFSLDGTQILGTTVQSSPPNTVILTAPYYDPGAQLENESISALWTTSILFPNTSRDCSHAILLQDSSQEEATWTFTYDRSFETFRAVRIDDLRNGTTYFTGPVPSPASQAKLIPCTLPAATYHGELVAAGFQGNDVWLYGVPEDLEAVPYDGSTASESTSSTNSLGRRNSGPPLRSPSRIQEPAGGRVPQWQLLCDKYRNTFVGGCKIAELSGVNTVKWVTDFGASALKERLVIAARGILPPKPITEEDGIDFIDGGRVTLVDFDYGPTDGKEEAYTIEVGTKEPETLEEEHRDMATEVAIVRRRTVAQRRGQHSAVLRAATTAARVPAMPSPPSPPAPREDEEDDPLVPRRIGPAATQRPEQPRSPSEETDTSSMIEEQEAMDLPYAHASPRSGPTLRRAATAAAVNRRLHPSASAAGHIEYRRADGRAEHPHESDADNWVPPPPPYQKEDPQDLPAFMRHKVPPVVATPPSSSQPNLHRQSMPAAPINRRQSIAPPMPPLPSQTARPLTAYSTLPRDASRSASTSQPPLPPLPVPADEREANNASVVSRERSEERRTTSRRPSDNNDIYDVSPPDSPRAPPTEPSPPEAGQMPARGPSLALNTDVPSTNNQLPSPMEAQAVSPLAAAPSHVMADAVSPQGSVTPPSLSIRIPLPSPPEARIPAELTQNPAPERLSISQTWPLQPPQPANPPAMLPQGHDYPHSAPTTNFAADEQMAAQLPPPPSAAQLASLEQRAAQGIPRRFSGGFAPNFHVPRVPGGSRAGEVHTRRSSSAMQQYPPQQQGQQPVARPRTTMLNYSAPLPPPPPPEQPLIISTPTGVQGAFDPPGQPLSQRRAETPILAPVPRHPPASPQQLQRHVGASRSTPSLVRPAAERLDTIWSLRSHDGGHGQVPPQMQQPQLAQLAQMQTHPLPHMMQSHPQMMQQLQQMQMQPQMQGVPVMRRPSQAAAPKENRRSRWGMRAKSIRRRKTKKDKRAGAPESDATGSSAAWTDVSIPPATPGGAYGYYGVPPQMPQQMPQQMPYRMEQAKTKKERGGKCVVM